MDYCCGVRTVLKGDLRETEKLSDACDISMKCLLNDTCIDRKLITLYSTCVGLNSDDWSCLRGVLN
jgi:hypothetical protein